MFASSAAHDDRPTRLLKERIRTLFRHLAVALAGDEEGIHQMRVAGRRTRVLLPLMTLQPDGKRVRRARRILKALVRTAGSCRDLDVSQTLLEAHVATLASPSSEIVLLRRRLRTARRRRRTRMTEGLLDQEFPRLRRDLRIILARGTVEAATIQLRLGEIVNRVGGGLLSAHEVLGDRFDPEELHRLRTQVRRLRYAAEVAAELWDGASDPPKRLKRLQEQLGHVHDTWVLAEWLERHAVAAERQTKLALSTEARHLAGAFREHSHAQHRTYLEHRPLERLKRVLLRLGRVGLFPHALRRAQ
ncbi:MAG: CHAD domain-containing protein [Candidatus Rokuibacteriota bacterium]